MKSTFPEQSKSHEKHIRKIAEAIVNVDRKEIAFVILFGSFARGNWVKDRYEEDGNTYEYASDYDILVVTKNRGVKKLEDKIRRELDRSGLSARIVPRSIDHSITLVFEPIDYVNSELEKSRYFFYDIKKEGILLYDSGELKLAEPRVLKEEEVREIARGDYGHWFKRATGFFIDCNNALNRDDYCLSVFYLHQSTESLYNCALLVFTNHKPKSHDLLELKSLCASQKNEFLTTFPSATKEQQLCFELLNKAYIEARYNKHYKISKEQLEYLIERVGGLKSLVENLCKDKI